MAPVLGHRVLLAPEARLRGRQAQGILSDIVAGIPVPVEGDVGLPPEDGQRPAE